MAYERRCTTPPNNGGRYQPGRWPPASEHPCASGPPASQDRREHSRQTADRLDDETGLTLTDWTHSNASARCPTPLHTSGRRFDPCRATTVIAGQLRFAGLTTGTADPRWAKNGPTGFAPPVSVSALGATPRVSGTAVCIFTSVKPSDCGTCRVIPLRTLATLGSAVPPNSVRSRASKQVTFSIQRVKCLSRRSAAFTAPASRTTAIQDRDIVVLPRTARCRARQP